MIGGMGGQKRPTVASKREMGQWQAVAGAKQEKPATQGAFFLFSMWRTCWKGMCWGWWGRAGEGGDVLVREGRCWRGGAGGEAIVSK